MKLTKGEKRVLEIMLGCNPCIATCCIEQPNSVDCWDVRKNGEYKCTFKRDLASLEKKLEEAGYIITEGD